MADDTKQRLILATIACIERKGLPTVTSRGIATEAQANVAAVNYHFGSKAKLIAIALQLTVDNAMEDFERALLDNAKPFHTCLHDLFVLMLEGGARYPNIGRAHLYDEIIGGEPSGVLVQRLNALMSRALDERGARELSLSRVETARRIELALRAVLMHSIAPAILKLTPAGASGVQEEADRLVAFIFPN